MSGKVANAPAAMGSRWRFVLFNPISLCEICPGFSTWPTNAGHTWHSAQGARDNRENHKDMLR